ncbi:MAG: ABC transporter transmembrane domain-containing protein, partial [Armatimonadota bacterium]
MHVLPEDVLLKVKTLSNGSELQLAFESDLDEHGEAGRRFLVATDDRILVISPDHGNPTVDHNIPFESILEVRSEPYIGSGSLIADVDGKQVALIRYSNSVAREFGYAARALRAIKSGEKIPAAGEDDRTRRCITCGFPLEPHSDACRNCVNRMQAISRLLAYLKPYRRLVITTIVLLISSQVLHLAPPYLTKILIDDVFHVAEPFKGHVPISMHAGLMRSLGLIVLGLIATSVFALILDIIQARITAFVGGKVTHDIRMALYSSLHRMPVSFFDKRQTGSVISRVTQDAGSLQDFLTRDVQFFITNSLMLVLVLVILFRENWKLAALTLIPAPLVSIAARMVFKRMKWMFRRVWHRWGQLHSAMSD